MYKFSITITQEIKFIISMVYLKNNLFRMAYARSNIGVDKIVIA